MSEKDSNLPNLSEDELRERYIKPAADKLGQMVRDGEPLSPAHIALLDSISSDWRMYYGISKWEEDFINEYCYLPPEQKQP